MNIAKTQSTKIDKKHLIIYIFIILFCIISIVIASYVQFYARVDIAQLIGIKEKQSELGKKNQDEIETLKANFDNLFNNTIQNDNGNDNKKVNKEQGLICTKYLEQRYKDNSYEININIPYININNEIIDEFNTDIKDTFEKKAKSIIDSQNNNVIYTVNYSAYVSNNILSLVVRSTLKEGSNNPQRDIVQTYNYDLSNQKKVTIDDMLELKGITKKEANQKIKEEIKLVQQKVENFKKLGYNIYERDYTNDMYSVNNVTEYFMGENNALYIIYAYGNKNYTSEMDIVVM